MRDITSKSGLRRIALAISLFCIALVCAAPKTTANCHPSLLTTGAQGDCYFDLLGGSEGGGCRDFVFEILCGNGEPMGYCWAQFCESNSGVDWSGGCRAY